MALLTDIDNNDGYILYLFDLVKVTLYTTYFAYLNFINIYRIWKNGGPEFSDFLEIGWNLTVNLVNIVNFIYFC